MTIITVPAGAVVLQGRYVAPTFQGPGTGIVTLTGLAPTPVIVGAGASRPGTGVITFQGRAPSVSLSGVFPGVGAIVFAGRVPTVLTSGGVIPSVGSQMSDRGIYYCLPTDIVVGTVSLTTGSADANYPLSNAYDGIPAKPFKATSTGCAIKHTFSGAQTLQGYAIINHNLFGATVVLSNNAGLSVPFTIPAASPYGLSTDPFLDLRVAANTSATQWTVTITGASGNVAIGELVPMANLRYMDVINVQADSHIPSIMHRTEMDHPLVYTLGAENRRLAGISIRETNRPDLLTLWYTALGQKLGFIVIPDISVNDARYMKFATDTIPWLYREANVTEVTVTLEESGRGPGV